MNEVDEPAALERAVLNAFGFLHHEFGFDHRTTAVAAPEMAVVFENETTVVIVHIELGSPALEEPCLLAKAPIASGCVFTTTPPAASSFQVGTSIDNKTAP